MNLFDLFRSMMQAGHKQTTFAERYGSTMNEGEWPISVVNGDFIAINPISDAIAYCPAHRESFLFPAQHVGFKRDLKVFSCPRCGSLFTEDEGVKV